MNPQTEAEWEELVIGLGADVARAWLQYVGAVRRAAWAAVDAKAAGVTGADRLLPTAAGFIDPNAPGLRASIDEPVARGFLTAEQAEAALSGAGFASAQVG